jgi:type II secretory pathway pseudopilin PulG
MRMRIQHGFTYLGLLFAVAIIGITLATLGVVWSTQIRRDKEADLLFAGDQIRNAIGHYYAETPSGTHTYPVSLEELLQDQRWPQVHRHLRRLYIDPMTASTDWQLIPAPEGGIMGVASTSTGEPIKKANFAGADRAFYMAESYSNWQFVYKPGTRGRVPQLNN